MNILCVCEGGNSRSVGLAWLLKDQGHNAVAVGMAHAFNVANGRQPGLLLSDWADRIVFMADYIEAQGRLYMSPQNAPKVRLCEVGKDTYQHNNLIDPKLLEICRPQLAKVLA